MQAYIPSNWAMSNIGAIANVVAGGTPKADDKSNFSAPGTGFAWLTPADLSGYIEKYISHGSRDLSEKGLTTSSAKLMPAGALLFSSRAPIGYVAIAANEISTNQGFKNFVFSNEIVSTYAYYYLKSIRGLAESLGTGTTFKEISGATAKTLPFVIPPFAEQKEISDRLDILMAQVEATQARLARIPDIIKKLRQSVLSAATAGNLTKSKEEWIEADLSKVASHIVDCPHSTPKWSSSGYYCVRTTAFNEFFLDLSAQGFVSADVYEERTKRLTPLAGDILYSREGTIGIACQIPEGVELCLGQRMVLIRAGHLVNSKYLTIVLNSNKIISIVRQKNIGSTVPRINMSDIKIFPIPLPALEEQTEIVRRVEQLFAYADTLELQAKAAKARVDNLTQAILAKAFRGELTADWRAANPDLISGDNSAAALLARIQAERATTKPRKRATKTSAV